MSARRVLGRAAAVLGILLAIVLLGLGGLYLWLRTSLPKVDGKLDVAGLHGPVTITRDGHGIPRVAASDAHDAIFALGFLHGQDRIFQMDMLRRYGAGKLAEIGGKGQLDSDRFMRTLGLARAAEQQLEHLSRPVREVLQAYADGVNAAIANSSDAQRPYYYVIPGPRQWQPADTLIVRNVMALFLSQNYRNELLHGQLAERLTPAQLRELYPDHPPDSVDYAADRQAMARLPMEQLAAALPAASAWPYASNNWVIDGKHSDTGKPLLENDPHLTLLAPSIWYLARLEFPGYDLTGGTIPGAPFVIVGHNGHIGWGFTETGGDVEDLFIEKPDPHDPQAYLTPSGSEPFQVRQETIHVRGGADVPITIRSTRHGPVISDVLAQKSGNSALPGAGSKKTSSPAVPSGDYVMALQATFLAPDDITAEALWKMDLARDCNEFRDALREYQAPQMNIVFAGVDGTIGFMAPGRIPIRRNGFGWVPHPGWTGDYDWIGYIPFDQLPQKMNPPEGHIVTANNKIVPDDYPYFITSNWALPYREERIKSLLKARPVQSVASTSAIAGDVLSLEAGQLLPELLKVQPDDAGTRWAVEQLNGWSRDMQVGDVGPLLYLAWLRELERILFAKQLGATFAGYWSPHPQVVLDILRNQPGWCSPESTGSQAGDCDAVLLQALHRALNDLQQALGNDRSRWKFGKLHAALFSSPVLSKIPLLGTVLRLSIPAPGANSTINAGIMDFSSEQHPFLAIGGPSLRFVLDFSKLSRSRFMFAPGVSENPLSPHYGDLMRPWRDVKWLDFSRLPASHTLTLMPSAKGRQGS